LKGTGKKDIWDVGLKQANYLGNICGSKHRAGKLHQNEVL